MIVTMSTMKKKLAGGRSDVTERAEHESRAHHQPHQGREPELELFASHRRSHRELPAGAAREGPRGDRH